MNYPQLPARLAEVRERIGAAQARSGRVGQPVTVVAVTKTHPLEAARAARAAGLVDLAENRVQDLEEKGEALGDAGATWHLIGHLQRNKVRRALPLFDLLHSLDSIRLVVEAVGRMAELPGLELQGLMTMAPFVEDEGVLRGTFGAARDLMGDVARQVPSFRPLHLSMGMSSDYEIAVEEGSTLVRLGTVLFGARET
jgi:uncharacterized pyridoxal phosphate-containing UPF0001 family protein